jgi:peptidoglycan/xylan/chitin deacetylase (PgdA/CDA1 family)
MQEIYLNFHGLGSPSPHVDERERPYWLEPERFAAFLRLAQSYEQEDRRVLITFDDGNKSDVDIALPILNEFKRHASFFPNTSRIGTPDFVKAEDVIRLYNSGMSIGSHGVAHLKWTTLSNLELMEEVDQSLNVLSRLIGQPIKTVAIPFGSYDRHVLRLLARLNITAVFTSDGGPARSGAWVKPRTTVRRDTPLEALEKLLSGRLSLVERLHFFARNTRRSVQVLWAMNSRDPPAWLLKDSALQ